MPYIGRDLNRGNYLKLDDISSSFNGSTQTFNLTVGGSAFTPGSAFSILVSVGGVIQEPESAYQVNNSEITFANAPTAQDSFFCIALGVSLGVGVPGNGTVNGTQMAKPFNYDGYFYLDDVNNRVGINSSTPTVALDVIGNTNISGDVNVSGILTAGTYSGPISNPSGISTFYNLRVSNNLTVEGTTTTLDTNVTGVDRLEINANSNTTTAIVGIQSGSADILNLSNASGEQVTILSSGNVGIGSAVPELDLDVTRVSSGDNVVKFENRASALSLIKYPNVNNADVRAGSDYGSFAVYTGGDSGSRKLKVEHGGNVLIENGNVGVGTVTLFTGGAHSGTHQLTITNNNPSMSLGVSNTDQLYVRRELASGKYTFQTNQGGGNNGVISLQPYGGSVGIGSATPAEKLDVVGNSIFRGDITASGNLYIPDKMYHVGDTDTYLHFDTNTINLHSGGTTGLSVQAASVRVPTKLGINGAAPQTPLDVIANGSGYAINVRGRSADNIGEVRFTSNDYGTLYGQIVTGPTYLNLKTGGVERLQLDATETTFNSTGADTDFRVRSPAQTHMFYVNAGTNQVSIKTGSPASGAELTVQGRTHTDTQFTIGSNSTLDAGVQATIYKPATNTLAFATAGANERLRINNIGEVYIGSTTTSGQGKLFVNDSSGATTTRAHIRNATATGTAESYYNLDDAKFASVGLENGELVFRNSTSSTPAIRILIKSDGIVGINNTSPEGKGIDVAHSRTNGYAATSDTRNLAHIIARNSSDGVGRFAALSFINGGGTQAEGSINLVQTGNYTGDLTFKLRTAVSTWAERLRITSDGVVIINQTSASGTKLAIQSTASSGSGTATGIRVGNNIGVLSQYPANIEVRTTGVATYNAIRTDAGDGNGGFTCGVENYNGFLDLTTGGSNDIKVKLRTNGVSYLNGGNVGINDASPAALFTVNNGTTDSQCVQIKNDNVGLFLGTYGTGHGSYPREATINGSRTDGGSSPFLRVAGQGGIKFCVDLNTPRMQITSGKIKLFPEGDLGGGATGTALYLQVSTDMTDPNAPAGGNDSSGVFRIEERGGNNNRYHGLELRNRNSGDVRILNQDTSQSNGANLIFAVDDSGQFTGSSAIREYLRIASNGVTSAKTLSGSYYPVASTRDGSTSQRAATSAWEIKKTLGPAARTGYYYLKDTTGTVAQWWCDMDTDGGGWILIAHSGEGELPSQSTSGDHWWDATDRGGFDTIGTGYYKGGGYWRGSGGAWAENTCGQLMWDVRTQDSQYDNYSNAKVVFNWGTDTAIPTGDSNYTNIPGSKRFNEWCYEVCGAPGFNPSNYHKDERSNVISGANYFTEHMVISWSFRGTGGGGDDGSNGPYWMIGSHHDGLHQHYEETLSGNPQGVYGSGGHYVVSNEDSGWGGGGSNGGYPRIGRHITDGTVNIWMR